MLIQQESNRKQTHLRMNSAELWNFRSEWTARSHLAMFPSQTRGKPCVRNLALCRAQLASILSISWAFCSRRLLKLHFILFISRAELQ